MQLFCCSVFPNSAFMRLNLVLRIGFCFNLIVLAVFASCAMKMLIVAGGKALTKSTPQILKRRDETAVREVVVEINSSTGVRTVELRRCYANASDLPTTDALMPAVDQHCMAEPILCTPEPKAPDLLLSQPKVARQQQMIQANNNKPMAWFSWMAGVSMWAPMSFVRFDCVCLQAWWSPWLQVLSATSVVDNDLRLLWPLRPEKCTTRGAFSARLACWRVLIHNISEIIAFSSKITKPLSCSQSFTWIN